VDPHLLSFLIVLLFSLFYFFRKPTLLGGIGWLSLDIMCLAALLFAPLPWVCLLIFAGTYLVLFLLAFGCVLCAGMYLARDYLPYIFTSDSEVVKTAARGIGIMCFVCTFNGFDRVLLNAMRAAGRSVVPMITAQFGCFSRIFFGWLIAVRVGNSDGIFYSLLLASFARMAAIAVYYYIGSGKQAIDRAAMRSM